MLTEEDVADQNVSISLLERLENAIHSLWKVVRDLLHLSTYLVIAGLLIYALWHADKVRDFIGKVGVQHAEIFGVKIDFVATAANNAVIHADEILATARSLNTSPVDAATKKTIESLANTAEELTNELKTVSDPVNRALKAELGKQSSSQRETTLTGWMFFGRTDQAGERWDTTRETVPMPIGTDKGPKFELGDTVRITTDAYLRDDGPEFALTSHRVIAVVPEGAIVRIKELRPNQIKSGGKYLWARVEVVR